MKLPTSTHRWTTIDERTYRYDISGGRCPQSTGSVQIIQQRRNRANETLYRIVQQNGWWSYTSKTLSAADAVSAGWIRGGM